MYYLFLIIATAIVIATMTIGFIMRSRSEKIEAKKIKKYFKINLGVFAPVLAAFIIMLIPDIASAAAETGLSGASGMGFLAAALSTGMATIGAGYAVGAVASSALGAVSEDPAILGKTLIFVGLAEGIAIYGLIISIMILGRL